MMCVCSAYFLLAVSIKVKKIALFTTYENCFGWSKLLQNIILNMCSGRKVCKSDEVVFGRRR